jgi:hypothetical protein
MALYNIGDKDKKKAAEKASEKVLIKRQLDSPLPVDNKSLYDLSIAVSKKTGVAPELLGASSLKEGVEVMAARRKLKTSDEYNAAKIDSKMFPIDGFTYYGLDDFSTYAPEAIKKGYLPKDFQYKTFVAENEKGRKVSTAAFRNNEDALIAKSALMKMFKDQVNDYSKVANVPLTDKTIDYLTMSAYNGGMGNAKIMIDELATGYNPEVFMSEGKTSRKGVHKNIAPRMERIELFKEVSKKKNFPLGQEVSLLKNLFK